MAKQSAEKREIRLFTDHILVKKVVISQSAGGIILPDSAQQRTTLAEVVAVGPGKSLASVTGAREDVDKLIPMSVKPGDTVLIGPYAGQILDGVAGYEKDHVVVEEGSVIGVVG